MGRPKYYDDETLASGEHSECVQLCRYRQEIIWNRTQALNSIRLLLGRMDSGDEEDVKTLRRQLKSIFLPEFAPGETVRTPKLIDFNRLTSRMKYCTVPEEPAAVRKRTA